MTTSFGAMSTTGEVLRGIDLSGKRVLVTGVSAGIGVESARAKHFLKCVIGVAVANRLAQPLGQTLRKFVCCALDLN